MCGGTASVPTAKHLRVGVGISGLVEMGSSVPEPAAQGDRRSKVVSSNYLMKKGLSSQRGQRLLKLDVIDRKIIAELSVDGRVPLAELGRRVSLSSPAIAERVQRLERAGVITGYRAEIDPRAVGYILTAIVRVKPAAGPLSKSPQQADRNAGM